MKKKTIEVCNAIIIDVSCQLNDSTDIKCGGPPVLGYDFGVSPDEDIKKLKKKVEKWCKKYHRGFMSIRTNKYKDFPVEHLWTPEKIENCIKENAI